MHGLVLQVCDAVQVGAGLHVPGVSANPQVVSTIADNNSRKQPLFMSILLRIVVALVLLVLSFFYFRNPLPVTRISL